MCRLQRDIQFLRRKRQYYATSHATSTFHNYFYSYDFFSVILIPRTYPPMRLNFYPEISPDENPRKEIDRSFNESDYNIFLCFLFASVEQSFEDAVKRYKRLFESTIQHSELVLHFLDTAEEILSSLLPRFDSLCLFCRMREPETKREEDVSLCAAVKPYSGTTG